MSLIFKDYRLDPEYLICKYISNIKMARNDDDDTIITNSVININYSDDDVIQIKVNDKEDFEVIQLDKKKNINENTPLIENNKPTETVKLISEEDYNKYKQLFDKFEKSFNIIENIKKWFIKIFNFVKKIFIK
ncbi:MAG: hypothetical protein IJ997_00745 [Mycoplasmataceae bacterium]|nr:hypothetical protein [Mycoplasmataceae bacterium]